MLKQTRTVVILAGWIWLTGCSPMEHSFPLFREPFRPQYHFTPDSNWINDPNGLVFYNGQFHLFFQHNPFGNSWGHMSWGHAISSDLVHWRQLPLAIPEEDGVMIFSGSCVVDEKNSSGFAEKPGQVPLVAVYTGHREGVNQSQYLAYSLDSGMTWKKYRNNPVLDLGKKDFRDPKVFWYDEEKKWVMAVVLPVEKQVLFYESGNLVSWKYLSSFGPAGDTSGIWECPDLFRIPVKNDTAKYKWVLMHSPSPYMQYFVGEFDGRNFVNENATKKIFRPDYGPDYYAAIVFNHLPPGQKPVSMGWVNNWNYANDIPTFPWKGSMSLPRKLSVQKKQDDWYLLQEPVVSPAARSTPDFVWSGTIVSENRALPFHSRQMVLKLHIDSSSATQCGVRIEVGKGGFVEIGFKPGDNKIYIDRSKTARLLFNTSFDALSYFEAGLSEKKKSVGIQIFLDESVLEVYSDDGSVVLTAQAFTPSEDAGMEVFSIQGSTRFSDISCRKIKSIH